MLCYVRHLDMYAAGLAALLELPSEGMPPQMLDRSALPPNSLLRVVIRKDPVYGSGSQGSITGLTW